MHNIINKLNPLRKQQETLAATAVGGLALRTDLAATAVGGLALHTDLAATVVGGLAVRTDLRAGTKDGDQD